MTKNYSIFKQTPRLEYQLSKYRYSYSGALAELKRLKGEYEGAYLHNRGRNLVANEGGDRIEYRIVQREESK